MTGRCETCCERKPLRALNFVIGGQGTNQQRGGSWAGKAAFALICGSCLAGIFNPEVAA